MTTTLGQYSVIGPLGSGGMSEIQLARAPDGTLVVLKRQLMPDDDPYLIDEGNLGLRLSHPGLVETRELFYDDERPVLALTYVPGVSLASLINTGPLSPASVCDLGAQIADALDALHRATDARGNPLNIIHRDVTPMNILVGFDGNARLIDLGIARFVNSKAPRTKIGDVRGTLHYLAPEVVKGGLHSKASDLWSLGVSLFEAAMGRVAVERDDVSSVLDAITKQRVLALRPGETLDIRVRHALAQIVNPEPRCRPAFAGDAAAILRIHASEHDDAKAETVDRVAKMLGKPAQTHLDASADAATKTAVLSQAELLFGPTHDQEEAPAAANPQTLEDNKGGPGADSLDLSSLTAPAGQREAGADGPASNFPEMDLDDDDKTQATPSPLVPEPISILSETKGAVQPQASPSPEQANPFALPPTLPTDHPATDPHRVLSPSTPLPVSALHEGLSAAPRPEDALPSRQDTFNPFEDESTLAAHPMVMDDLAKKSVQVNSQEGDAVAARAAALDSAFGAPVEAPLASPMPEDAAPDVSDRTLPLSESPSQQGWQPPVDGNAPALEAALDPAHPTPYPAARTPPPNQLVSPESQTPPSPLADGPQAERAAPPPAPVTDPQSSPSAVHDPFAGAPVAKTPPAPTSGTAAAAAAVAIPDAPTKTAVPWVPLASIAGVALFAFVVGYAIAQWMG